jgi:hypothetical protein
MMTVKINIAYNMKGMTLPDLDDLYIIRSEMMCRLHI